MVMVRACGFTRDGGAPTITNDCATYQALEGEAQRLKAEVDGARALARTSKVETPLTSPSNASPHESKQQL